MVAIKSILSLAFVAFVAAAPSTEQAGESDLGVCQCFVSILYRLFHCAPYSLCSVSPFLNLPLYRASHSRAQAPNLLWKELRVLPALVKD